MLWRRERPDEVSGIERLEALDEEEGDGEAPLR